MKRIVVLIFVFAISGFFLHAQMIVSGILDSSVSMRVGAGDEPDFSCGIEEFANIRFQSRLRDKATVFGAVNFIAASGVYANDAKLMAEMYTLTGNTPDGFNTTSYVAGDNYIAAIELERLYFRLNGEHTDFEGGLMRFPFGYGQVWGSSDFLNPKNPLKPDARPRGVLGAGLSWYPHDDLKLLFFTAAGRDAFAEKGEGSLVGFSLDRHWEKMSIQTLYTFELPKTGSEYGIHRAGLSVKADVEIGLVMDALYTYNYEAGTELEGLSFSIGADYSFFEGNLIVLAEYLYNGKNSSTAFDPLTNILGLQNEHNLYTGLTWRFNDFTNMSVALMSGLDDSLFIPILTFNHELFQGAVLTIMAQMPLNKDVFSGDEDFSFNCTARLRLRF
jgi:hypothetical protein